MTPPPLLYQRAEGVKASMNMNVNERSPEKEARKRNLLET